VASGDGAKPSDRCFKDGLCSRTAAARNVQAVVAAGIIAHSRDGTAIGGNAICRRLHESADRGTHDIFACLSESRMAGHGDAYDRAT
jgi:hypothetical protein